jgi:hypothetical protein
MFKGQEYETDSNLEDLEITNHAQSIFQCGFNGDNETLEKKTWALICYVNRILDEAYKAGKSKI